MVQGVEGGGDMRRNWKLSQNKILDSRDESFFIHYSCESLNDSNECLSPRITSIVVLNFGKEQAESFSIHLSAESLGIKRDDIKNHYDEIEKDLLTKFNEFLASNIESSYCIHSCFPKTINCKS